MATETQHWSVSVSRNGDNLVTIESNMLAGQPEFSDEEARVIRECAAHLLAFIGPAAPVGEPAAMPPVEVGDWVLEYYETQPCVVRADNVDWWNDPQQMAAVDEIRKANGGIWRRTDRKEPTS